MTINDNDIEKVLSDIDNPTDKLKFERLYLLYKFYNKKPVSKITYEEIDNSIKRINKKFKNYIKNSTDDKENKELLNRLIKINTSYKNNSKNIDSLLNDITYIENELRMVPSFPSYIENILESQINNYKESKIKGKKWKN